MMNSIGFALLLLVFSTIVLANRGEQDNDINGGFTELDVCSSEIRTLAIIAMKRHYSDGSYTSYQLKSVIGARKQIVAGVKHLMELKICRDSKRGVKCQLCEVETVEKEWLKDFEVSKFECVGW